MFARTRALLAVVAGFLAPHSVAAQGVWVGHQPPCRLSTGHFLVRGGVMHLKLAVESRFPDERGGRLEEARQVLHRALIERDQTENPAAWYYLGRTYAERLDMRGADSAFRRAVALEPNCAGDIAQYTSHLAALTLNDGLRVWGEGSRDSATVLLRLARQLDSTDAEIPLYTAIIFASGDEPDSASRYLELGLAAARTDTAHGARLKQAQLEVARAYETRAYREAPALPTAAQARVLRDSTARQIARDSALLEKILTEVGGIRTQGQRLNPQSLAVFQRDSTTLANRLAANRQARDTLGPKTARDSVAIVAAAAPAIRAYRRYLTHYPEDAETAMQLVRLYTAAGDRAALDSIVDRVAASPHPSTNALVQAGLGLYHDGLAGPATRLLEAALKRNPNDHSALAVVVHAYYAQGMSAPLLEVARRRLTLAPLDPSAARAVAMAFDLAGARDSAQHYLNLSGGGLGLNVQVSQFGSSERSTSVSGYVTNVGTAARPATELTFEFLDAAGQVLFSTVVTVPALERGGRAPLSIRLEQGEAASWRYRQQ